MSLKIFSFVDCSGDIIFKEKLTSLPIKKEYIINRSIELFSDSDPCIIHSSYIKKMIYFEINDYFDMLLKNGNNEISREHIADSIMNLLDIKGQTNKVIIFEV